MSHKPRALFSARLNGPSPFLSLVTSIATVEELLRTPDAVLVDAPAEQWERMLRIQTDANAQFYVLRRKMRDITERRAKAQKSAESDSSNEATDDSSSAESPSEEGEIVDTPKSKRRVTLTDDDGTLITTDGATVTPVRPPSSSCPDAPKHELSQKDKDMQRSIALMMVQVENIQRQINEHFAARSIHAAAVPH